MIMMTATNIIDEASNKTAPTDMVATPVMVRGLDALASGGVGSVCFVTGSVVVIKGSFEVVTRSVVTGSFGAVTGSFEVSFGVITGSFGVVTDAVSLGVVTELLPVGPEVYINRHGP